MRDNDINAPTAGRPGSAGRLIHPLFWILLAALLLRIVFFVGVRSIDHFLYVRYAHDIVEGVFAPEAVVQSLRIGFLHPLALIQWICGINEASSVLYNILCSLGLISVVYALGKSLFDESTGLFAATIVAVLPLDILQSSMLFPDTVGAFFSFLALAFFLRVQGDPTKGNILFAAAGLALGWGYVSRETCVFMLVVFAFLALRDRRWRAGYIAFGAAFLGIVALDLAAFQIMTGDPFFRYRAMSVIGPEHIRAQWFPTSEALTSRMVWEIPALLIFPLHQQSAYFMFAGWCLVPALIALRRIARARVVAGIGAALLICIWVWPVSLSPYIPALFGDGRYLILLEPPIAILIGAWLTGLRPGRAAVVWTGLILTSLAGTAVIHDYLTAQDEGHRAAFAHLERQGAKRIAVNDNILLFQYLTRYDPSYDIRTLEVEDLEVLRDAHIVLDERQFVRSREKKRAGESSKLFYPDLRDRLTGWTETWSITLNERMNPLAAILGRKPGQYSVHVFRRP